MKHIILIGISTLLLLSCQKPDADFKLDRSEYVAGEQLEITNLSLHSKRQKWEIVGPEGIVESQSIEKNPNLMINILGLDGVYTVKLTAYRSKEKRGSSVSKTFIVKAIRQELWIHYYNWTGSDDFVAYIDNQLVGSGTDGELIVKVPIGLRFISIKTSEGTFSKTVEITKNNIYYVNF